MQVDYMWDDLRKEFLRLDPYGTGFVSCDEFRDVLQELCVHLNAYELDMLSRKFDTSKDGRWGEEMCFETYHNSCCHGHHESTEYWILIRI